MIAVARFNYDWSDTRLQRFIKEGRGQGEGKEYKPWLQVNDISSKGRVTRLHGNKADRMHHFLSDMEKKVFYLYEFEPVVVDIREHYPLLDLLETPEILDSKMKKRLIDNKTSLPHILTTTFLIKLQENGQTTFIARSVKLSKELEKNSVIELYEIQRRYWSEVKKIDYGIITEKEIPEVRCKNLEWLHSAYDLQKWNLEMAEVQTYCQLLIDTIRNSSDSLRSVIDAFDQELHLEVGTGLLLFKHLIARHKLIVDLNKEINFNMSTSCIQVVSEIEGGSIAPNC